MVGGTSVLSPAHMPSPEFSVAVSVATLSPTGETSEQAVCLQEDSFTSLSLFFSLKCGFQSVSNS